MTSHQTTKQHTAQQHPTQYSTYHFLEQRLLSRKKDRKEAMSVYSSFFSIKMV